MGTVSVTLKRFCGGRRVSVKEESAWAAMPNAMDRATDLHLLEPRGRKPRVQAWAGRVPQRPPSLMNRRRLSPCPPVVIPLCVSVS